MTEIGHGNAGWRRHLPRSLMGQMLLVFGVTLLLTQIISLAIFSDERRAALESLHQDETISRIASMLRVLDRTPDELHNRILQATTSRRLRFWISDQSALKDDSRTFASNWLAERLRRQAGLPESRKVRVDIREIKLNWFQQGYNWDDESDDNHKDDHKDDHKDGRGEKGDEWHDHHGPVSLLIAVELSDGRWLNAENLFRGPSRHDGWPPVVTISILVTFVALVSILLIGRLSRPMRRLADAADRLGRGEHTPPLDEYGPRETRNTIRAFNRMNERLRRFIDDRTRMMAATGHDLRTPLTSLRLRAELVEDEALKDKMLATIDEMTRMVEAMLAFAREDAVVEETRDVDVSALLASIVDDLDAIGLPVTLEDGPRMIHRCRPVSLTRAVRNLIENAARHGGSAAVRLREKPGSWIVEITDDGPGIPDDMLEKVFEPFIRLDEARNQNIGSLGGSLGLGLAIARSIVRGHGGDIRLANRPEGGLLVEVTLPEA